MNLFGRILVAIAPLFSLIALGYAAKRLKILSEADVPSLNKLVVQVTLPAFVLDALLTHSFDAAYVKLPLVIWIAQGVVFASVLLLGRIFRWQRAQTGTALLTGVFGNTGFVGYPMTTAILPALLPAAVLIDQVGMALWLYPGALVLGSVFGGQVRQHPMKAASGFLRSPLFLAFCLGLALRLLPQGWIPANGVAAQSGRLALTVLGLVASATIPVVLIAVGLTLRPKSVAHHGREVLLIAALKLLLLPTVAWLAGRYLFGLRGDLLEVCVLEAAMPPSAAAMVFAGEYGMDGRLAVATFFALTLVSALTMPLLLAILR